MSDNNTGIYCITNLVNGKKYIGRAVYLNYRLRSHNNALKRNSHASQHLQNAWNKYGENNFTFRPIFLCNRQDLNDAEIFFIYTFNTTNKEFGYNTHKGGSITGAQTQQIRHRVKKVLTEEHKEKIRQANLGHFVSDETRDKLRRAKIGFKHTEETKQKEREMFSGSKNPMYGKKGELSPVYGKRQSQEAIDRSAKAKWKAVAKLSLETGEILEKFDSVKEAAISIGQKSHANLSSCCNSVRKSVGGYKWKYI